MFILDIPCIFLLKPGHLIPSGGTENTTTEPGTNAAAGPPNCRVRSGGECLEYMKLCHNRFLPDPLQIIIHCTVGAATDELQAILTGARGAALSWGWGLWVPAGGVTLYL